MVGNIFIRKETSGTGYFNARNRVFNVFIESAHRQQFAVREIKIPFQIHIIVVGRFQIGITLTLETDADITERRYFFSLRQGVCFAGCQTERMFIIKIIAQIQAGQYIVFINAPFALCSSAIHIIVYIYIYVVILYTDVCHQSVGQLVSSFYVCRMDIFVHSILVDILILSKNTVVEVCLVIIFIE